MPKMGRKHIEFDQFYTSGAAVKRCIRQVDSESYDCVIEPSAGGGAFLQEISNPNIIALDIEPASLFIVKQDYLTFQIPSNYKNVLIVGNPPFGVRHALSDAFLKKSFSLPNVKTVAFVLPNTYNKPTRQQIIPKDWRIKSITPLERDSFLYNGEVRHIPCSFFVFDKSRGPDLRFNVEKYQKAKDFEFSDSSDFEIFIFGANPGRVTENPQPNNRGYFLKSKIPVSKLTKRLEKIKWTGNSCASGGVAWFTRWEIVKHYNDTYS